MVSEEQLSNGDSQVLSHIFDPESAPSPGIIIDASLPADTHIHDASVLSTLKSRELQAIRYVESASEPNGKPKDGDGSEEAFMKAFEIFSSLIDEYPKYALHSITEHNSYDGNTGINFLFEIRTLKGTIDQESRRNSIPRSKYHNPTCNSLLTRLSTLAFSSKIVSTSSHPTSYSILHR